MRTLAVLIALGLAAAATPAAAQLVPALPHVDNALAPAGTLVDRTLALPRQGMEALAQARLDRIARLVRAHPDSIALDANGFPARARELVVSDADPQVIARAEAKGFRVIRREEALGVAFVRLETPRGISLRSAERALRKLGARDVSADQLHFPSGEAAGDFGYASAPLSLSLAAGPVVGMIDGGVAGGGATQAGFAAGAPRASDHGSAVASLIAGHGNVRGGAPGARVFAADVYGSDPAGGSATAIAKALGWLAGQGVPVVTISLVGPQNPLLQRVVAAAQARGMILVAAVGNDGPASPPAFPASYPGVVAVTAVDARKRLLIEAGRALHLDYAAPGADMLAANARGGVSAVRGTSFAAPLVAARIAQVHQRLDPRGRAAVFARVDGEAERLGSRYGRGLVCGACRTPPR